MQGVGSKVALAILGTLPPDELALALGRGDKAAVARSPGVGPKLAARIVAELKDKGPALGTLTPEGLGGETATTLPGGADDAVAALVNLGYARAAAVAAIADAVKTLGADAATAALIRHGLKRLAA